MLTRLTSVLPKSVTWPSPTNVSKFGTSRPKALASGASFSKPSFLSLNSRIAGFNAYQPLNTIQTRGIRYAKRKVADANVKPQVDTSADEAQALIKQYKKALVIDEKGENLGVVFVAEAWEKAKAKGLKLNKVRDGDVPVIRFETKAKQEVPAKDKRADVKDPESETLHDRMKEVRISDQISEHDLQVKVGKARQQLLSKYKVRFDMRFKKRWEFDPVLAQVTMENVLARLQDVAQVDTAFKIMETGAFMVLKPQPRKKLIAEGHVQIAEPEEKEPSRREISAAKRQAAALEREELASQGVVFKKFLSPAQQTGDSFGIDIKPVPKKKKPKPVDDFDEVVDDITNARGETENWEDEEEEFEEDDGMNPYDDDDDDFDTLRKY